MKKLPIGVQTFDIMINDNYLYIDKTEIIYKLLTDKRYYFFSRPRRFGKSLLISTFKEIFQGNKVLFKDLAISKLDYDWTKYPVIHLDFSNIYNITSETFEGNINLELDKIARKYDLDLSNLPYITLKLKVLVEELAKNNKVVILIDEYDYPLLSHLSNLDIARKNQEILRAFYATIKSLDGYMKFIFITGITKFTKTSLFSGLNNLDDISYDPLFSTLLGYTQNELESDFSEYIEINAKNIKTSKQNLTDKIKFWYNGYRFSSKDIKVYNPYSTLLFFDKNTFQNYWYETGTPSYLINLMHYEYKSLAQLINKDIVVSSLGTFSVESIPLITLLFQAGYLTIKDYNDNPIKYHLGFPNEEVKISFERHLLAVFTHLNEPILDSYIQEIHNAIENYDLDKLFYQFTNLLANIPYQLHIEQEKYYHSLFQLLGTLLGLDIQSEISTDKGRIDLTIITNKYIYVIEFKFNESSKIALEQIEEKKYYQKFLIKNKKIILIGVSFNRTDSKLNLDYASKEITKN